MFSRYYMLGDGTQRRDLIVYVCVFFFLTYGKMNVDLCAITQYTVS